MSAGSKYKPSKILSISCARSYGAKYTPQQYALSSLHTVKSTYWLLRYADSFWTLSFGSLPKRGRIYFSLRTSCSSTESPEKCSATVRLCFAAARRASIDTFCSIIAPISAAVASAKLSISSMDGLNSLTSVRGKLRFVWLSAALRFVKDSA